MGVFSFIRELVTTARSPLPAGQLPDSDQAVAAAYHRRIVRVGGAFAVIGVSVGVFSSAVLVIRGGFGIGIGAILVTPPAYGAGGFLYGMAVACLFAPRAYLAGPAGQRWMRLIGTESVAVARVVCFLFWLIVTIPAVVWVFLLVWLYPTGR